MRLWVRRLLSDAASNRTAWLARAPSSLRPGLQWMQGRPWVPDQPVRTGIPVHVEGEPAVDDVIDVMIETEAGAVLVQVLDGGEADQVRGALARTLAALAAAGMPLKMGVLIAPELGCEWPIDPGGGISD